MNSSINRLDWKSLEGSVAEVLKPAIRDSMFGQQKLVRDSTSASTSLIEQNATPAPVAGPSADFDFFEELANDQWMTSHAAFDHRLNRHVMIRQLKPKALQNTEIANQFWERAKQLASVEHHHVARVHDVDPQRGWIILERLTSSVASRLASGHQYTVEEAFLLFKQGLDALSAFHQCGQSHGAICTSNLAVTEQEWLKLTDPQGFSIDDELPLPDETRRHIAPEMLNPDEFGTGGLVTDLYCLGFAILDALAGDKLDEHIGLTKSATTDVGQAWTAWHTSPRQHLPSLAELIPGIEGSFEAALLSVTNKKTSMRPQNAQAVLQQLNQDGVVVPNVVANQAAAPIDQLTNMQDYQLQSNTAPGAVLMGETAKVYSIPDEIVEEPDLLDKLSDIDWWNEQVRRPVVHVPVIALLALIAFVLMQSPVKTKDDIAAKQNVAKPIEDKQKVTDKPPEEATIKKESSDQIVQNEETTSTIENEDSIDEPRVIKEAPPVVVNTPTKVNVHPVPAAQPTTRIPTSWPLECRSHEQTIVRSGITYFLEDAWEQRTLSTAPQFRFERLHKVAPLEPRLVYAYGLFLLEKSKYEEAREVFALAVELQNQLFQKKMELSKIYEGDPVPTDLQPIPNLRPRQMLIWTTLMQCANNAELVEECAMQISQLLQQMNVELPSSQPSLQIQNSRNESVQFAGRAAGLLKAHFSDRLRREVMITEWLKRCETSLKFEDNPASPEEHDLFQSSIAEMVDQHHYELEALVEKHERIVAEQSQKPAGPVITKEHTIENEEVTKREDYYYWGEKESERTFTSKLSIKSTPVRTYERRRPQMADVSLRALFPPDLLHRREVLKQSIPEIGSTNDLAAR